MIPSSDEAQAAIGEWFNLLNKIGTTHWKHLKDLVKCMSQMTGSRRILISLGKGLAVFMRDAMAVYVEKGKKYRESEI